jgi:hypothetical protein
VFRTAISTGSEYVFTGTYENLSPSDVNFGPIPSRRGFLEDNLYHEIFNVLFGLRHELGRAPRA